MRERAPRQFKDIADDTVYDRIVNNTIQKLHATYLLLNDTERAQDTDFFIASLCKKEQIPLWRPSLYANNFNKIY